MEVRTAYRCSGRLGRWTVVNSTSQTKIVLKKNLTSVSLEVCIDLQKSYCCSRKLIFIKHLKNNSSNNN